MYARAFDLARRLELPESLDLALRIAESHGEEALTTRVEDLVAFRNDLANQMAHADDQPQGGDYAVSQAYDAAPMDEDLPPPPQRQEEENLKPVLERRSSNAPSPVEAQRPAAPFKNPFAVAPSAVSNIDALRF